MREHRKTKRILVRFLVCVWLFLLVFLIHRQIPDNNLHLVFCDVGQGDAIIIRQKYNQVIVDGGKPKNFGKLLNCLNSQTAFWDKNIELVISTHPEDDHFGGLLEVFSRYHVKEFFHSGADNLKNPRFQDLKKILFEQKICSRKVELGDSFNVGKIYFDVLSPGVNKVQASKSVQNFLGKPDCQKPIFNTSIKDFNSNSVVVELMFKNFNALLTGDTNKLTEQILVWRNRIHPVEILKVAHHGSKTSTSDELLRASKPQLAVISVGQNSFGHPTKEVLNRLKENNIKVLRTDLNGTIEIISNGEHWWVK